MNAIPTQLYATARMIPRVPTAPPRENPWAKKRRAQLMTRMEQSDRILPPGIQFLQYQRSPFSAQRAAAVAARDLGTTYEQELPNFTAENAGDFAEQRAIPSFLQKRGELMDTQSRLPWQRLNQENEQFGQQMKLAERELAQKGELGHLQWNFLADRERRDREAADRAMRINTLRDMGGGTPEMADYILQNELPAVGTSLTPQMDRVTGQTGYQANRPPRVPRPPIDDIALQSATQIMASFGLNNILPETIGASTGMFRWNPTFQDIGKLSALKNNLNLALQTAGDPMVQTIIKSQLSSLIPSLTQMQTVGTFGNRTKQLRQLAAEILNMLQ